MRIQILRFGSGRIGILVMTTVGRVLVEELKITLGSVAAREHSRTTAEVGKKARGVASG